LFFLLIAQFVFVQCDHPLVGTDLEFRFKIDPKIHTGTMDGRLILLLSDNAEAEPRFQISDGPGTQIVFGMDVEMLGAGNQIVLDESNAFGYPMKKLSDIPPGEYYLQAVFHKYEILYREDGSILRLPMDNWEGQQWNRSPGNIIMEPQKVVIKAGEKQTLSFDLGNVIENIPYPENTTWVRYIRFKSEMLSRFWGRDFYLGAFVLLPYGFEDNPDVKYPLAIMHGHFPSGFSEFRELPPDEDLEPDYSQRFDVEGYNRIQQEEAHDFYKQWTSEDFPRVLAVKIQHANPFYDDSYAVNSANIGPYGDAITYELIPHIEKEFRGIGEGWARFLYGGSTGGWEALAAQVFYPDEYNGCYAACPDPIDFRAFTSVNIYEDRNAYWLESKYKNTPRPGHRDYLGHISSTLEEMNQRELALGTKTRSGQQWDVWEAVYSPVGEDGYPKRIWDKETGEIDKQVAEYWRENYDLRYILERDWDKLGPKLKDKIHIYCGDMDNYYLNNAVYLMEDFLEGTEDPYYNGEVDYGDRAEHCWNGDHENPNHISRLRYHRMFIRKWVERIDRNPPEGADVSSWRY